jgi:long-chain acyl-CoA synthetase
MPNVAGYQPDAERHATMASLWRDAGRSPRTSPAFLHRSGRGWKAVGWPDAVQRVERLSAGLLAHGIGHGDRVGLLLPTSPDWTVCDFALLSIGAVPVPLYMTSSRADVAHILRDCGARTLIVDPAGHKRVAEVCAEAGVDVVLTEAGGEEAETLAGVAARGDRLRSADPRAVETARDRVRADDIASIVYTSGTTGEPKGCVLTHGNLRSMTDVVAGVPELLVPGETVLLFLPLAHSFARLMQNLAVKVGITIAYCPDLRSVPAALTEVRPHILPSIPRAWELLQRQIAGRVASGSPPARAAAGWALRVGADVERRRQRGRRVPLHRRAELAAAEALVLDRIRARVGGRLRLAVSGGAPLPVAVAESLAAAGIRVMEGYGLSEATCASNFNLPQPGGYRFGSVGRTLPGIDVRIAADGEVQVHGPNVFAGYYGNDAATRAVMTGDGWLATGDLGAFDGDGFLSITGRKKDLIVTSGGDNVAPLRIEEALIADPLVSQALVLGDRRPYIVALLTVDPSEQRRRKLDDDAARAAVAEIVDRVNRGLGTAERVRRHAVLPQEFSQERGEVTPTLKIRRDVCVEHNAERIAELYGPAAGDRATMPPDDHPPRRRDV